MEQIQAAMETGPAVKAGLEFIWVVSFGQVLTAAIALVGFIFGFGKVVAMVFGTKKEVTELRKDIRDLGLRMNSLTNALLAKNNAERVHLASYEAMNSLDRHEKDNEDA